jgi:hypothetical protein
VPLSITSGISVLCPALGQRKMKAFYQEKKKSWFFLKSRIEENFVTSENRVTVAPTPKDGFFKKSAANKISQREVLIFPKGGFDSSNGRFDFSQRAIFIFSNGWFFLFPKVAV